MSIDKVAGGHITTGIGAAHQGISHLRFQVLRMNASLIVSGSCPDGEQKRLSSREHLRVAVADFAFCAIDRGHLLRGSPRGRNLKYAGEIVASKVDGIIRPPGSSSRVRYLA